MIVQWLNVSKVERGEHARYVWSGIGLHLVCGLGVNEAIDRRSKSRVDATIRLVSNAIAAHSV